MKLFARKKVNPRKAPTGTSYKAKGVTSIPPPKTDSELGSATPSRIRDIVPALASPFTRLQTYTQMESDASVDASMRAAKTPILGAEFFVEPFSDDPLDLEISEFIWANLAEGMATPFIGALEDILRMYQDGYSVLEKVYEQREWAPRRIRSGANTKNFIMLKKLGVRPASTIASIQYDQNGGPNSVTQNSIQPDGTTKEVVIDVSKLLIFTFGRVGGDLTGRSLLRTAYMHWYYKNHMYKIDAIQKERHALGVPKGKLLPGWTPADRDIMRTMLRNLRTNEEAFMILTPNVDVEFAEIHGNLVDVLESALHHGAMIQLNILAQFIALGGQGTSGSRAVSSTQADLFMKSLKYVANLICQEINMYLIPELVVWNYPTKNFPKLNVRNIGETRDLQMLASAIANLYAQGAITPTAETEAWIRRVFDMPTYVGEWSPPAAKAKNAPIKSNAPGTAPGQNGTGSPGVSKGQVLSGQGDAGNVELPPNSPK